MSFIHSISQSSFLDLLNELESPLDDESFINDRLFLFRKSIFCSLFEKQNKAAVVSIFERIWTILIELSANEGTSVRINVSKTIGTFFNRMLCVFPDEITDSFSKASRKIKIHQRGYQYIVAVFSRLTQMIAPPYLLQFQHYTSFNHFLAISDPNLLENIPKLIDQMGALGLDWFRTILIDYLILIGKNPHKNYYRCVSSIIKHHPNDLYTIMFKHIESASNQYIPMLSFVFKNVPIPLIEMKCDSIIQSIFDIISNESSSISLVDSALSCLSSMKSIVSLDLSLIENENVRFEACSLSCQCLIDRLVARPDFFGLPLPLDFLLPKDGDGVFVIDSIFSNLGNMIQKGVVNPMDVFSSFQSFISIPYSEKTSGMIKGFSKCCNQYLIYGYDTNVSLFIRKLLFSQPVSWIHALDICHVFYSLDFGKSAILYGDLFFNDSIHQIVSFLSFDSIQLHEFVNIMLLDKINENNIWVLEREILGLFDVFDSTRIIPMIKTLTIVYRKFPGKMTSQVSHLYSVLFEYLIIFKKDIPDVLSFLATNTNFLANSSIDVLSDFCLKLLNSSYFLITGKNSKLFDESLGSIIYEYTQLIDTDVVSPTFFTIFHWSCIPLAALCFLLSLEHIQNSPHVIMFCKEFFYLFPNEISYFFEKNWNLIGSSHNELFQYFCRKLKCIHSPSIHSCWTRIAQKIPNVSVSPMIASEVGFLHVVSTQFLDYPMTISLEDGSSFSSFLFQTLPTSKQSVISYIVSHNYPDRQTIMRFIQNQNSRVFNDISQLIRLEPTKTTNNQTFQPIENSSNDNLSCFYKTIQTGDIKGMIDCLDFFEKESITLNVFKYSFPDFSIPIIAEWASRNCVGLLSSFECLKLARTHWREYCLGVFRKDPAASLVSLVEIPKFKKAQIFDFISLIGFVDFDKVSLFSFARSILQKSTKKHHLAASLRLFAATTEWGGLPSRLALYDLVELMNDKFQILPIYEFSQCVFLISMQQIPDKKVLFFLTKCLNASSPISPESTVLHSIIIRFIDEYKNMGKGFSIEIDSLFDNLKRFTIPSFISRIGRFFISCTNGIKDDSFCNFSKSYVLLLFQSIQGNSYLQNSVLESLNSVFLSPRFLQVQKALLSDISRLLSIGSDRDSFHRISSLLETIFSSMIYDPKYFKTFVQYIANLFSEALSFKVFQVSLRLLQSILKSLECKEEQKSILDEISDRWLQTIKNQDIDYLYDGIKALYLEYQNTLSTKVAISFICDKVLRYSNRFFPVYSHIVVSSLRGEYNEWKDGCNKAANEFITNEIHKKALIDLPLREQLQFCLESVIQSENN